MIILILSVIVLFVLVNLYGLRFTNTGNFGSIVASSLAGVVAVSFALGYRWQTPKTTNRLNRIKFFLNMTFLSISYGAVVFLLAIAATTVVSSYAPVIQANSFFMAFILAFILSSGAYATYSHAAFMTASRLAGLFVIFISAGAIASMLTSQDDTWLQHHFSALGAGNSLSSYAFNFTMIVGGFLIVALLDYILLDLEKAKRNTQTNKTVRMNFLRIVLVMVGVCSIGIGIFPYDRFLMIHNIFANVMTISFMVLALSIPWTVPMFSKSFIVLSYVIVAIALSVYLQFFFGDLNIFIIELIDAVLLFLWMIILVRQIAAIGLDQSESVTNIN
ncbi:hypothetical protein EOL73_03165 [Candidatus Saccharibacteria bacterium]|nr:hypothetical protein [Candidatus Saccharibacteria bacterium]NCU40729.1 hypothetical protein [Candidatus Saccharibacteria bacterium]